MTNWQWCFGLIEFGAAWWCTDRAWRKGILGMWISEERRQRRLGHQVMFEVLEVEPDKYLYSGPVVLPKGMTITADQVAYGIPGVYGMKSPPDRTWIEFGTR